MLVLLIDDSGFQRNRVKKGLQARGYETLEAGDGLQALELLKEQQPNLILCDLLMPNMSGFEFLQAQKDRGSTIPIIILTADIQEGVKQQCVDLGAAGFLNKPVKPEQLLEAIDGVLS